MQQMAATHDVSKQAIGAIALELEALGYIMRRPDPDNARQVILMFTPQGRQLIADSFASVNELAEEFTALIGARNFNAVTDAMARIYQALHLEEDIFGRADEHDPHILARQLHRQLGEDGAKSLGRLLLSGKYKL